MFFILSVSKPNQSEITRLQFGCQAPAEFALNALVNCGFDVDPDVSPVQCVRNEEEQKRAQQLTQLIFDKVKGHA